MIFSSKQEDKQMRVGAQPALSNRHKVAPNNKFGLSQRKANDQRLGSVFKKRQNNLDAEKRHQIGDEEEGVIVENLSAASLNSGLVAALNQRDVDAYEDESNF